MMPGDTSSAVVARAATSVATWAMSRAAGAVVKRMERRAVRFVRTRATNAATARLPRARAVAPPPPPCRVSFSERLGQPFMGTQLTQGRAVIIFVTAPAFWLVVALCMAALPA